MICLGRVDLRMHGGMRLVDSQRVMAVAAPVFSSLLYFISVCSLFTSLL